MPSFDRLRVWLSRLQERLWVRPLAMALLSVVAALAAKFVDRTDLGGLVPEVHAGSLERLLSIIASSMLVIATFAVGSMVSAYSSASTAATPRSFALVVSDDVSQNALSTFIGAFIFSIVALTAVLNGYYEAAGLFALFVLTVVAFAIVILTFVRWVDRIARLGRLGETIEKVEDAAGRALARRRLTPHLRGKPVTSRDGKGQEVRSREVGYVQHVDVSALQEWAEEHQAQVVVMALPGTLATPARTLACLFRDEGSGEIEDVDKVHDAFEFGSQRLFVDDPRFGLIVLAQIASRALSPAVNDSGTAIDVIVSLVRILVRWSKPLAEDEQADSRCDRVEVPAMDVGEMFDDAFTAIARDGAGTVEVMVRLQKALQALCETGDAAVQEAARRHGRRALDRAEKALDLDDDLAAVRGAAAWLQPGMG